MYPIDRMYSYRPWWSLARFLHRADEADVSVERVLTRPSRHPAPPPPAGAPLWTSINDTIDFTHINDTDVDKDPPPWIKCFHAMEILSLQ